MQVIHKWTQLDDKGNWELETKIPGMRGKAKVTAEQAAKKSFEEIEEEIANQMFLEIYPSKRERLEPVLKGIMALFRPGVDGKGDIGTAMLLTKSIADVRAIVYANPPIEVIKE